MTLRVTLEIIPYGNEDEARTIHTFNISNLGSTSKKDDICRYAVEHDNHAKLVPVIGDEKYVFHSRKAGAIALAIKALVAHTTSKDYNYD